MTTGSDLIPEGSEAVTLSLQQFSAAWRLLCRHAPDTVAEEGRDVDYVFSGLPIPFFNVAIITAKDLSADELSAIGQDACAWASGRLAPWMLVVTHEGLAPGVDAPAALDAAGLAPVLPMTGMLARDVAPPASVPAGLQLSVPQDTAGCSVSADINAAAYGMELEAGRDVLGSASLWKDHVLVIGSEQNTPVSSAAVLSVDGYRYVALVATTPAHQRRGFADATMRHALHLAAGTMGDSPTVLHATAAGRPVYERMGYTPISEHTMFMEKRFLDGH